MKNELEDHVEELFAFTHNKHHNNWISIWEVLSVFIGLSLKHSFDFSKDTGKKQFKFMLDQYVGKRLVGVRLEKEFSHAMKKARYRFVAGAPQCSKCKVQMALRKTMQGDAWICKNYYRCGERRPVRQRTSSREIRR